MKSRGLRVTAPRRIILAELERASGYVSAEEIYLKIHPDNAKIGLATVYRTLTLLVQMGVVTRFEFGDGKARYELSENDAAGRHHHVLVCERCYRVLKYSDFSSDEKANFDRLEAILSERYRFNIHRHVVQYYGLCEKCRE
jgi:Fur family transcriptional regulator, ferric uptake regulator